MGVKLGREFDKNEKSFIDYHKDILERGDLKEIQELINSGMTGRAVLLLWAYLTNNLTIHTESLPDGIQMVTLALKGYTGGNDEFPFIESDCSLSSFYHYILKQLYHRRLGNARANPNITKYFLCRLCNRKILSVSSEMIMIN